MAWFSPDEARFLQKCERSKQGCWIWLGYKMPSGYGTFRHEGRKAMATHAALEFDGRARPSPEHFALHSCDNPSCVNPDHLRWGLQQENVDDMCQRGRLNQGGLTKWRNTKTRKKWSHCKRGHPLEGANVSLEKNGQRLCVACKRIRYEAQRDRARLDAHQHEGRCA